jgi:hypothetical protein
LLFSTACCWFWVLTLSLPKLGSLWLRKKQ